MGFLYLLCLLASIGTLLVTVLRRHPAPATPPTPPAPVPTPATLPLTAEAEVRVILAAATRLATRFDTAAA